MDPIGGTLSVTQVCDSQVKWMLPISNIGGRSATDLQHALDVSDLRRLGSGRPSAHGRPDETPKPKRLVDPAPRDGRSA